MTCPLCVQWRCSACKSQDWPQCCGDGWTDAEAEPFWPDGSVAVIDMEDYCPSCAEALAQYEVDRFGDAV